MQQALEQKLSDEQMIHKASQRAAEDLGVTYGLIENHLEFIRFYDNLMRTVGNDVELARHWVYTGNRYLGYTPILRVHKSYYLKEINQYLESFQ